MTAHTTKRPTSVPTTREERNGYLAILQAAGIPVRPSTNGATLRKMAERQITAHREREDWILWNAGLDVLAFTHAAALEIDAQMVQERLQATADAEAATTRLGAHRSPNIGLAWDAALRTDERVDEAQRLVDEHPASLERVGSAVIVKRHPAAAADRAARLSEGAKKAWATRRARAAQTVVTVEAR